MLSIGYLVVLAVGISLESRKALRERDRLAAELAAQHVAREAERDFVALLSHELRTPLATIEASTQVLRDVDTLGPDERERRLGRIERSVRRLRDLFDRQLASDRILQDWQSSRRESVNLVDLLAEARDQIAEEEKRGRILVHKEGRGSEARALVDRDLLIIALGNLLVNALSYGPPGQPVRMALAAKGGVWRLSVTDAGPPLATLEAQELFSPYRRGALSAGKPGAGLGLYIVRRIAVAHGGAAGFDPSNDLGNTFWIDLPIAPV
jgi:signal transduction histidine kinase